MREPLYLLKNKPLNRYKLPPEIENKVGTNVTQLLDLLDNQADSAHTTLTVLAEVVARTISTYTTSPEQATATVEIFSLSLKLILVALQKEESPNA